MIIVKKNFSIINDWIICRNFLNYVPTYPMDVIYNLCDMILKPQEIAKPDMTGGGGGTGGTILNKIYSADRRKGLCMQF